MFKAIKLVLLSLALSCVAHGSDFDFAKIKQSVFNIAVLKGRGVFVNPLTGFPNAAMRATAFSVNTPKFGTIMVTNNHVCRDLYIGLPIIILNEDGYIQNDKDFDLVTDVFTEAGQDICIFKTKNQHPGLNLSSTDPKRYDKVTITGFDGEVQMMISQGYIYGSARVAYYDHMQDCESQKFQIFSPNWFVCRDFKVVPIYKETIQLKSTAKVSPGWSGSPVLNDKSEVVAIVNAYDIPTETDNKSESYLHTASEIQHAIDTATFVPFNDKSIVKQVEVTRDYEEIFNDLGIRPNFLQ